MSNPAEEPDVPEVHSLHEEDEGEVEDHVGELIDDPFLMEEDDE